MLIEHGLGGLVDILLRKAGSLAADVVQPPKKGAYQKRDASRPVRDLFSRRSVNRAARVEERLHERFEVFIVECPHPDGHRVEDLPEIGRSGFFRPAHFTEGAPAAGDQPQAGLLRERAKLIPERFRQIGACEDMIETVENDQYPCGCSRHLVEDEVEQLVNVLVLDVEILGDLRAMRLQRSLDVLREMPLEVAVRPDSGMSKIDMHCRQVVPGTRLVGVSNVSEQDGLPVVCRTDHRDVIRRRLREMALNAPD